MRGGALMLVACVALAPQVRADGLPEPVPPLQPVSGWSYQFTPYAWVPWVQGNAVVRGRGFNVYADPVDVLEHLDFSWMSYMQAKKGPLTLFSDIIYVDESTSGSVFTSKTFASRINATLGAAVSADYRFWTVEAGAMYELTQWRSRHSAGAPDTVLEILAGGRYWHQDLDVDLNLAGTLNLNGLVVSRNTAIARSGSVQWIDPFIGARLRWQPAQGEEVALRGDVGGFGAGSQFSWQALATYNWRLCQQGWLTLDGYLGYRALAVDYEDGAGINRYVFDAVQHGPLVGVRGRF